MPEAPFGDLGPPPYIGRFGEASFQICACCGFEYGYDDDAGASGRARSFAAYLEEFLARGCKWFSPRERPEGWSLEAQLREAGLPDRGAGQDPEG
jgi:hypothetical protein